MTCADQAVAEDRPADLGKHRRVLGDVGSGVGGVHQVDDTHQQKSQNAGHPRQHATGVGALRLSKDIDRVGDCLDSGQRGTAVGERAQQHQDRRAHDQPVALMDRHRSDDVFVHRIAVNPRRCGERHRSRSSPTSMMMNAVHGHREYPARLLHPAQVGIRNQQQRRHGDFQVVRTQPGTADTTANVPDAHCTATVTT